MRCVICRVVPVVPPAKVPVVPLAKVPVLPLLC